MNIAKVGLFGVVLAAVLAGCVGRKDINYLNDKSLSQGSSKLFENRKFETPKLRFDDHRCEPNPQFLKGLPAHLCP